MTLTVMVFFMSKDCTNSIEQLGKLKLYNVTDKKPMGSIKVSRTLDTFLFLQEYCKEITKAENNQCFKFEWKPNGTWLGSDVEQQLCKMELQAVVNKYELSQKQTCRRQRGR